MFGVGWAYQVCILGFVKVFNASKGLNFLKSGVKVPEVEMRDITGTWLLQGMNGLDSGTKLKYCPSHFFSEVFEPVCRIKRRHNKVPLRFERIAFSDSYSRVQTNELCSEVRRRGIRVLAEAEFRSRYEWGAEKCSPSVLAYYGATCVKFYNIKSIYTILEADSSYR